MASIGDFYVQYRATADKFLADLQKMGRDAKEFDRTIAPLRDQALNIGTAMSVVGGAVTAAFVGMAKQAANYGDAIRDASIRTGISTESLSALKVAAEQSGTSFEGITASLNRLSKSAASAAMGSKESAKAFAAIGVSVKDASGQLRPMDEILSDVAERFAQVKDGTDKAALAQRLFGRSGTQMIELLNQGKAGLEGYRKEAERLGLSLGADAVNAADRFNDSLNLLKNAQLGLSVAIGNAVLPALTRGIEIITNLVVKVQQFAAAHPEAIRVVLALAGAIAGAGGLLVALAGVLTILPKIVAAFALIGGPITIAVAAVAAFAAAFAIFPEIRAIVNSVIEYIIGLITRLAVDLGSVGKVVHQLFTGQFKEAFETVKNFGKDGVAASAKAVDTYRAGLKKLTDGLGSFTTQVKATDDPLDEMRLNLNSVSEEAAKTRERFFALSNFLRGAEGNLEAPINRFKNAVSLLDTQVSITTPKIQGMVGPVIDDIEMLNIALQANTQFVQTAATKEATLFQARQRDIEATAEKLKNATEDVKRSAGEIFDAMFIKGESVFSSLQNALKGGALSLGRSIFEDITGALLGPIKAAFDDFFQGLLEGTGIKALVSGLGSKLGGALGNIIPGGGGAGTALSAAGVGAGVPGGPNIPGTGSGGGLPGMGGFDPITAGLGVVNTLISAFAGRGREQRTEENTRETRDWLELQTVAWNPLFHKMEGNLALIEGHTRILGEWLLPNIEFYGEAIVNTLRGISPMQAIQGSTAFHNQFNFDINVEPGATLDELYVRSMFERVWTDIWENNTRGMAGTATSYVVKNAPGMVTG